MSNQYKYLLLIIIFLSCSDSTPITTNPEPEPEVSTWSIMDGFQLDDLTVDVLTNYQINSSSSSSGNLIVSMQTNQNTVNDSKMYVQGEYASATNLNSFTNIKVISRVSDFGSYTNTYWDLRVRLIDNGSLDNGTKITSAAGDLTWRTNDFPLSDFTNFVALDLSNVLKFRVGISVSSGTWSHDDDPLIFQIKDMWLE